MFLNYQDKISKGCAFCCSWTPQPARLLSPERRCCPNSEILIISAFNNTQNVKHLNFAAESVQQERLKKATRNIPRRCRSLALSINMFLPRWQCRSVGQCVAPERLRCYSFLLSRGSAPAAAAALSPLRCALPCGRRSRRSVKVCRIPRSSRPQKSKGKTSGSAALAFSRSPARGVPLVLALQYLAPNFPAAPRPGPVVGGSARPRARLFLLSRRVTACLRKPAHAGCRARLKSRPLRAACPERASNALFPVLTSL